MWLLRSKTFSFLVYLESSRNGGDSFGTNPERSVTGLEKSHQLVFLVSRATMVGEVASSVSRWMLFQAYSIITALIHYLDLGFQKTVDYKDTLPKNDIVAVKTNVIALEVKQNHFICMNLRSHGDWLFAPLQHSYQVVVKLMELTRQEGSEWVWNRSFRRGGHASRKPLGEQLRDRGELEFTLDIEIRNTLHQPFLVCKHWSHLKVLSHFRAVTTKSYVQKYRTIIHRSWMNDAK